MRGRRAVVLAVTTASLLAGCSSSVGEPGATSPSATGVASPPLLEPSVMPSVTESAAAATVPVFVFLGNSILGRDGDCSLTFPVPRRVAAPSGPVELTEAAVEELLAGPTQEEVADGYTSWFSSETTAGGLISVRLVGDTAYVNLVDHAGRVPKLRPRAGPLATSPNSRTPCGLPVELPVFSLRSTAIRSPSGTGSRWTARRRRTSATRPRSPDRDGLLDVPCESGECLVRRRLGAPAP